MLAAALWACGHAGAPRDEPLLFLKMGSEQFDFCSGEFVLARTIYIPAYAASVAATPHSLAVWQKDAGVPCWLVVGLLAIPAVMSATSEAGGRSGKRRVQ